MLIDSCAMKVVMAPQAFDVILVSNLMGDILSDVTAGVIGGLGFAPSGNIGENLAVFEPIHGSAPDIAGKGVANPLATILSAAMMLRYTLNEPKLADKIEQAVSRVLDQGLRTGDIYIEGMKKASTAEMGDAVVKAL